MASTERLAHRREAGVPHANCTPDDQPLRRATPPGGTAAVGLGPTVGEDGVISLSRRAYTLDRDERLSCEARFEGGGGLRPTVFAAGITLTKDGRFALARVQRGARRSRSLSGTWAYDGGIFTLAAYGKVTDHGGDQNDPFLQKGPKTRYMTRVSDFSQANQIRYVVQEASQGTVIGFCVLH